MEFGPQSITVGPVQIRYYGIIIVAAILVAATVAARLAKRDGRDPDHVWGAMFGAVILGIIGARLWFILFPPQSLIAAGKDTAWYFQNFFNLQDGAIAIWSGGLHIFGAFLGGFIGAYLYLRQQKLAVAPWLDIAAVVLPLGQAIGRWANFINQELYGAPTGVDWWGIAIESQFRVAPYTSTIDYPANTLFHPLFLYESLWNIVAFMVLLYLWQRFRHQWRPGTIFLLYVAQYAFIRYILEFVRVELSILTLGDLRLNVTQLIAGIAFLVSVGLLLTYSRSPHRVETSATPPSEAQKSKA
jgi:phosphatidylglycerol---prolipoprotein diacylglyceryl transferase